MSIATLDSKTDSPVFAFNFRETTVPEKVEGYYDEALDKWIMPDRLDPVAYGTNPYDTITTIITGLPGGGSQMDDTSTTDYGDEVVWC